MPANLDATRNKTPIQNALSHWERHRGDFPSLQNAKQYVEFAINFLNHPPATALTRVRPNGDVVIYDPVSDIFGVRTSTGVPRTLFKPDPAVHGFPTNLDYYLNTP
jgi:filamentous hemagglutinin